MREAIIELAEEAGRLGSQWFRHAAGDRGVEEKAPLDLVTRADRDIEAFLKEELNRLYPDDGICGEEGTRIRPGAPRQWVIDPVDGTFNFVRGLDAWAVSIGRLDGATPDFGVIHAPARGETISGGVGFEPQLNGKRLQPLPTLAWKRGVIAVGFSTDTPVERELDALRFIRSDLQISYRHNGSTAVAFVQLATGEVDACLGFGVRSWDVMGALPILTRQGAVSTIDWQTRDLQARIDYLAGSAELVARSQAMLDPGCV